ncbi:MAG: hypothetical protein JWO94_1254, partial [Verrucomicrobiaceae bacterium]|nr:hypothetical protein [Verrucomicrobiaceae bacterium]
GTQTITEQPRPFKLLIQTSRDELETTEAPYESASLEAGVLLATGAAITAYGSRFVVHDAFQATAQEGVFQLDRKVEVIAAAADGHDRGFASEFALPFAGIQRLADCEVFAPGVWYRHNEGVRKCAYGSNDQQASFLVRENALALPLFSLLETKTGRSLTLCHDGREVAQGTVDESEPWPCHASIRYGSIGIVRGLQTSLAFVFPCHEGETTYARRERSAGAWMRRSHPVQAGFSHSYSLLIRCDIGSREFAPAMTGTWRAFYRAFSPLVHPISQAAVYQNGIAYLEQWYRKFPNGAAGWPWEVWLDNERPVTDWHLQSGFVGQQLPAAYLLIRHGVQTHQPELVAQGREVVDFWVRESLTDSGVPRTDYFVDARNPKAAHWMGARQQIFLRTLADGVEGVLDAYQVLGAKDPRGDLWLTYCRRVGNALLGTQNADGSWPRSFRQDGQPEQDSKLNTTHPLRFLTKLYQVTKDERLHNALLHAGEFCLREIDAPGRYVGGTPDNPNAIDKEAGVIALNAFLALHALTDDARYLAAARRAADYAETWIYMWSFPIHGDGRQPSPWPECGLVGQSLVATGHSYADSYMVFASSAYACLHQLTGDRHYLDIARLLQNNTLAPSDFDGRLGYRSRAMIQEGVSPARFSDHGSGSFLLWNLVAELYPLTEMEDRSGTMAVPER